MNNPRVVGEELMGLDASTVNRTTFWMEIPAATVKWVRELVSWWRTGSARIYPESASQPGSISHACQAVS